MDPTFWRFPPDVRYMMYGNLSSSLYQFCFANPDYRAMWAKMEKEAEEAGECNNLMWDKHTRKNFEFQELLLPSFIACVRQAYANKDEQTKNMIESEIKWLVESFQIHNICSHGLNTPEIWKDKIDHCHEADDGSLYCDLCNIYIGGRYEYPVHAQTPSHVCKRNAFLKLDEVPSLLAQDRLDEVQQIFDDNAK